MSNLDLALLQFALACGVSVLLGGAVWLGLRSAARRWPALVASRAVWVAAQLALLLPLLVVLLPRFGVRSAAPVLELRLPQPPATPARRLAAVSRDDAMGAALRRAASSPSARASAARDEATPEPAGRVEFWAADIPAVPPTEGAPTASSASASAAASLVRVPAAAGISASTAVGEGAALSPSGAPPATYAERMQARVALAERFSNEWARENSLPAICLRVFAWLWFALYVSGAAWQAIRTLQARAALRALLAGAHPAGDGVLEVDAPISPMLAGLRRPVILIPSHLRTFSAAQQALIIEHERTHLRRRDPWLRALRLALGAVCWFNPAMRALGARLDWAQELGCDAAVLARRSPAERKSYAAALVAQLRAQIEAPHALAMAFGSDGGSMADRIASMRGGLPQQGRNALPLVLATVALLAGVSLLLQPALANPSPAPHAAAAVPAPQPLAWAAPLDRMRVSSFYGVASSLRGHPHGGIDIAARRGTPVHAPADGMVDASTDSWQGQSKFGKVIVLRHDGGMETFYAHLDRRLVKPGARVAKGDIIGYTGATGRVTGPHLHFEVWDRGAQVDPETVLGALTANATANALKGRAAR